MKKLVCLLSAFVLQGHCGVRATTLDPNFSETPFATVGSQVTGLAWAPDGSNRLFVSLKTGAVQIVKNGSVLGTSFATLSPIYTGSECGLIGMCFDPNFVVNGYVYLFVTVSSSEQQIIRYTAVGDVGVNKTVLVPNLPTAGANHDGGSIGVGADGKLYWGIGDNGNGTGVDGNLTSLAAKIGRANLDGSIPLDNPFVDGVGPTNDYIWARGFRNPYTLTFQPTTGLLWVNCVGTSYEQIFLVQQGNHAGYNDYENNQPAGYITPKIKYRTNGTDTRNVVAGTGASRSGNIVTFTTTANHGFRQGEKITVAGVANASFNAAFYVLDTPSATTFTVTQAGPDAVSGGGTATTLNQGGCVTGGCFYDSTAVPAAYRQNFFYGDLNSGRIMRAILTPSNTVSSVDYFANNLSQQIDITVGPDGAMYYVTHPGNLYRLAYTNYTAQQLVVTPTVTRMFENGLANLTIRLAQAPAGTINVSIARTSGAATIDVVSGATLSFTPGNWSVPQVVQFQAAPDDDNTNDTATFTVSAPAMASETITVHALDLIQSFSLGIGSSSAPIQLTLTGQPAKTYVVEATTNLVGGSWVPINTNTLATPTTNIVDPGSTNLPIRFYRARWVP